ncbi:phage tail domain-containing protein [Lactococcus carnosus]|uniref:Phage tail protein n=1 Tax=Pseudolactococcus carnosus TaxID=2749961 RepID=A0ABT0AQQ2_9LACT|nr:phage tail domain-containing protein [Lactococcus carnosus]MCJ1989023.1 phage tail protein [Lactococcus carnosus]
MGVIINNQNTKILGFALKGRPSIPSANKKYETIEIEGRDGSLTRFLSYEDLKFSLTFNILFQDDIKQKLREIKGLMSQAKTLSFDDSPNFFYKIKQAQVSDTESIIRRHGVFSVDFVADSFEYEASSVLEYVNPTKLLIRNNTTYFSQPIIKIFGEGNIKLTVNDELIELKNVMDGIILDSEKQEAYLADVNKNSQMVGNFPNFEIGENQIICTGKVNKVEILPNWRWLT